MDLVHFRPGPDPDPPDKKTDLDPGLDKASKSGVIFFNTEISYLVLVLIKPPECFFFLKSHVFSFEKK